MSAARGSTAPEKDSPHALAELLRRSRFEVLPLDGIEDEVLEHLPTDTKVTVTASPSRGLEATLDLSERLARAGYPVVPHLSARLVRDSEHLEEVLARLREAGVRELFVPAGDATEPGQYHSAADLLAAMGGRVSALSAARPQPARTDDDSAVQAQPAARRGWRRS